MSVSDVRAVMVSRRVGFCTYNCESLSSSCINVVANNFQSYARQMRHLPTTIKDKLLQIASRREDVLRDVEVLSSLLHPGTRQVDLRNCDATREMIESASAVCRDVEILQLACDASVSTTALLRLISRLPRLRVLRAKKCAGVDDEFVRALVRCCTLLQILDIAKCNITDASMLLIGRLKLSALDVSGITISDRGFGSFASGECKHTLKELIVTCPATACRIIEKELPNLTIFVNHSSVTLNENFPTMKQLSWTVE